MQLYINYPSPRFSIYQENLSSGNIQKHNVRNQRHLYITSSNYETKINQFLNNFKFNSTQNHHNDLWVSINTATSELSEDIANKIL